MIFSYLLNMQSHPSWVCGLKPNRVIKKYNRRTVTPFVGVWIETATALQKYKEIQSHTLRGCVD